MKRTINISVSKRIDLLNIAIVLMFLLLIINLSYGELEKNAVNFIILGIIIIGTMVGYFTDIIFAILYSIIFDFIYASVYIFLNLTKSVPLGTVIYVWMVVVPLFTLIYAYKGKLIKEMQVENYDLKKENLEYVTVDKETGLQNSRSFLTELQNSMNISTRYDINLYMMLVELKYGKEIMQIIGKAKHEKIIKGLSETINNLLRQEDKKFRLLDEHMFAIIFFTRKEDGELVKNRLRNAIREIQFKESSINKVKIVISVGLVYYNKDEIENVFEYFNAVKKDMEYDVAFNE